MNITAEMIKNQAEALKKDLEGYHQGYTNCLNWILTVLSKPEDKVVDTQVEHTRAE